MHRILSCFLLTVLLATISHTASAIVGGESAGSNTDFGCDVYTDQAACNNAYRCWWNLWSGTTATCVSCSNILPNGARKTTFLSNAVSSKIDNMSPWTGKWQSDAYIFCPYELTCMGGAPVKTGAYYDCGACSDNSWISPTASASFLITSSPNNSNPVQGLYTISATSTTRTIEKVTRPAQMCQQCGINAHANSNHSNCDCDKGYAADVVGHTLHSGVGINDCTKLRVYTITVCDKNGCDDYPDTLYYQYGVGYGRSTTGTFNGSDLIYDEGSTGGTIWETKKNLVGWALKQGATKSDLFFTGNTLSATNHDKNIIDYCETNTCESDANGNIKLYPVFAPKKYKVKYQANVDGGFYTNIDDGDYPDATYGDLEYVKPNEWLKDEDTDYKPQCLSGNDTRPVSCRFDTTWSPAGKYFVGWKCDSCEGKDKILKAGEEIPEPITEYKNHIVTLTAVYANCPSGYYCVGGVQHKCPAGSTSSTSSDGAGAGKKSDCFLLGGTTRLCKSDDPDCITLPTEWGVDLKNVSDD